jgi:hypothetical protein
MTKLLNSGRVVGSTPTLNTKIKKMTGAIGEE